MRPLRYSINITLDGCCDHRVIVPDEELHRRVIEKFGQADARLFGRATCELMEAGWRRPVPPGTRPDWMEAFARTIGAMKKYVGSSTLERVDRKRSSYAGIPARPHGSSSGSQARDCSRVA
jgi:hypothetical protein